MKQYQIWIPTVFLLTFNYQMSMANSITSYSGKHLTELQKQVAQGGGTEKAFNNEYWNNHDEGIYVDIISGEPLFSSIDKFDSGTGWPSFTKPIDGIKIVEKVDYSHGMKRVEARSTKGNTHLGHIFNDGPKERGGKRYCMNSASMKFIPKADLEKEGYREYVGLFEEVGR